MPLRFSVNFDYGSPFARNASEHVLTALAAGADLDVRFTVFSLAQGRAADGGSIWGLPGIERELTALAAGVVVRDRFPERFPAAHLSLFSAAQDEGRDLRRTKEVQAALERAGVDHDAVGEELADGWPYELVRAEHEEAVARHAVFGTPTFIIGEQAAFVRLMTRPEGDTAAALATVDYIVRLVCGHPEINEFKRNRPYSEVIESVRQGRLSPTELQGTISGLEAAARSSTRAAWRAVGLSQFDG
jgi:hypothetical protein